MKKLLLLIMLSACSLIVVAQKTVQEKIASFFGFYTGPNLFSYRGDEAANASKHKIGFQAGVLYNIPIGNDIYVQPEINVSLIGARYKYPNPPPNDKQSYNMTYINLVIIGQYHTNAGVYFELGPQVGYLISAKSKSEEETVDLKDRYKKTALGVNLGLGYEFNENWRVGARYTHGGKISDYVENDIKYNGASLNVRYCVR